MARKVIPVEQRAVAPFMMTLPLTMRQAVERIAEQEKVSLSELGRRAIADFIAKQKA